MNAQGKISKEGWIKIATTAAVAAGAYFLVLRPLLLKFGLMEDPDVTKTKELDSDAFKKAAETAKKKKAQTYDDGSLLSIADIIHESLRYSALDDNKYQAVDALLAMNNDADVYRLIELFGTREECYFGIMCTNRTLPQFVASNLSDFVSAINKHYAANGITYRF